VEPGRRSVSGEWCYEQAGLTIYEGMMGVGRMENEYELIAAFLGMLDKIQKAESAVLVVNGWPLAELHELGRAAVCV